jgi:DNA-directed RNA polymerase specialized sigma subunit
MLLLCLLGLRVEDLKQERNDIVANRKREVEKLKMSNPEKYEKEIAMLNKIVPKTPVDKISEYQLNFKTLNAETKQNYMYFQSLINLLCYIDGHDVGELKSTNLSQNRKVEILQTITNFMNFTSSGIKNHFKQYLMGDLSEIPDLTNKALYIYTHLKWCENAFGIKIDFSWFNQPELNDAEAFKNRKLPSRQAIDLLLRDLDVSITIENEMIKQNSLGFKGMNAVDIAMELYGKKTLKAGDAEVDVTQQIIDYDPVKVKNLVTVAHINLVIKIAKRICMSLNQLHNLNDAIGFGTLGLTEAVNAWEMYQAKRNVHIPIDTFIKARVNKEIIGGLSTLTSGGLISKGSRNANKRQIESGIFDMLVEQPYLDNFLSKEDLETYYMMYNGIGEKRVSIAHQSSFSRDGDDGEEYNAFETAISSSKDRAQEDWASLTPPTESEIAYVSKTLNTWVNDTKSNQVLTKENKMVLLKMYIQKFKQEDIAKVLGIGQATVSKYINELEKILKKLFERADRNYKSAYFAIRSIIGEIEEVNEINKNYQESLKHSQEELNAAMNKT